MYAFYGGRGSLFQVAKDVGCQVLGNSLNLDAVRYLQENVRWNGVVVKRRRGEIGGGVTIAVVRGGVYIYLICTIQGDFG